MEAIVGSSCNSNNTAVCEPNGPDLPACSSSPLKHTPPPTCAHTHKYTVTYVVYLVSKRLLSKKKVPILNILQPFRKGCSYLDSLTIR